MKFSEKLQYLRKERNMSQEGLADLLDVSRQSVSKWESGQTYPEMDKLISMCSIFKCTLDDLTNDEVTEIGRKNRNGMSNIIDEGLDIIRKSIDMFKSMSFKSIIICGIEMMIIFLILLLFNLPVKYIYNLGNDIFINFGFSIGNILSSIWNFILQVSYLILASIIFIYIYKIRFLDKFDYNQSKVNKEDNIKIIDEKDNEKKVVITDKKKESSYTIFNSLGKLALWFIKFIIICISIPFIFALFFLTSLLVIGIILVFKGILYFGPILMVIFTGIFVYLLLELIYNFIFNRQSNKKRIFILFISSIVGLGIGFGVSAVEVANTEYINEAPRRVKETTLVKEYQMKNNLFIMNYWHNSIQYIVDESLVDNIKIETTYYQDYSDVIINYYESDGCITINRYDKESHMHNKILKLVIEDLSNKTIYAYGNLQNIEIKIYTSSNNIETIKNNEIAYNQILREQEKTNQIEHYNYEISRYQNELNEKENRIYELESKITNLENEIEEYKYKIEEFKSVLD